MKLFLLRHAEAIVGSCDEHRMLTERGHSQISDVVARIDPGEFTLLTRIEHSPYRRARETAESFKKAACLTQALDVHQGLTPDKNPFSLACELGTHDGDRLFVGHNPLFERLAGILLVGADIEFHLDFQTAACIALERFAGVTRTMPYGYWKLRWFIIPGHQ